MESFEHKKRKYENTAAITFVLSAAFLTIPMSQHSQEKLRRLWGCTAELDAYVDSLSKNETKAFAENVLRYIDGETEASPVVDGSLQNSLRLLRDDLALISPDRKKQFVAEAGLVFEKARILSQVTDVEAFVRERAAEGVHLTNMALLLIDEFTTSESFQCFYRKIAAAATLMDSIVDAVDDYKNGEMAIKPSAPLYFSLAKETLRLSGAAILMHPRKMDFFAAAGQGLRAFG